MKPFSRSYTASIFSSLEQPTTAPQFSVFLLVLVGCLSLLKFRDSISRFFCLCFQSLLLLSFLFFSKIQPLKHRSSVCAILFEPGLLLEECKSLCSSVRIRQPVLLRLTWKQHDYLLPVAECSLGKQILDCCM